MVPLAVPLVLPVAPLALPVVPLVLPAAPLGLAVAPLVAPGVPLLEVAPEPLDAIPVRAFMSTNCPDADEPAVPVAVPAAVAEPEVPTLPLPELIEPPCCRQPVTVMAPGWAAPEPLCDCA